MIEINNEEVQVIQGVVPSKSNCYRIITLGNHASLAKTPALKSMKKVSLGNVVNTETLI